MNTDNVCYHKLVRTNICYLSVYFFQCRVDDVCHHKLERRIFFSVFSFHCRIDNVCCHKLEEFFVYSCFSFSEILQFDSGNADAIYVRGMCLYYQDNPDAAFTHFQHVLRLAPDHQKGSWYLQGQNPKRFVLGIVCCTCIWNLG